MKYSNAGNEPEYTCLVHEIVAPILDVMLPPDYGGIVEHGKNDAYTLTINAPDGSWTEMHLSFDRYRAVYLFPKCLAEALRTFAELPF